MSHTPHELVDEFPEHKARIHDLKMSDMHFSKLFDDYHEVNRFIHRAETNVEPVDDMTMQERRKQRMELKDRIYRLLSAH